MSLPIAFRCTEGVMKPVPYYKDEFARTYEEGRMYRLQEVQDRSEASHRHFFASVTEAWRNLPEDMTERFPSAEHLRKWCLIRTGYSHSRSIACDSPEEAQKVAAFVRPFDEFAVVSVGGCVVTVFTAMSQSLAAMGAKEFQASKEKVLDLVASMIRTDRAALEANAETVA